MTRTAHRSVSALLALVLALAILAASPRPAQAHDSCAQPLPAATGVVGVMLNAVNVFASFINTTDAACPDKYAEVDVKLDRDWAVAEAASTAATSPTFNAPGANQRSNAPRTHAPCINGMAAGFFPCDGVDLLSHVSHSELGTTFVNDIWGWEDPQTGKEYALVGASNGTVFVEITDPKRPLVYGILPTASTVGGSSWRDIKVYRDHAYVVSEHRNHGVQVFDLTKLRSWNGTYTTYSADARYTGHGSAHNININEDTGFLYSVGAGQTASGIQCGNGLHMIDINDPKNPTYAGCFQAHGYIHDTQCVVYEGPDAAFQGREICFNSNGISYNTNPNSNFVSVVDVTDKANPVALSRLNYEGSGYSHQGWLTEDQRWFLHGDEGDEFLRGVNTTTRVWDMADLRNPRVHQVFVNDTTSIDHNLYTKGDRVYASNYTTGLRVYDSSDLATRGLREVAYFDLYPENDDPTFEGGTWSNYPYYKKRGIVATSSIDRGLFILQARGNAGR